MSGPTNPRRFNEKPRPWVLVYTKQGDGYPTDEAVRLVEQTFPGTVRPIEYDLQEVHASEWDAVVCFGGIPNDLSGSGVNLHVAAFGARILPVAQNSAADVRLVGFLGSTRESLLELPDGLPSRVASLVSKVLVPTLALLDPKEVLTGGIFAGGQYHSKPLQAGVAPLLRTPSGSILAGLYLRPSGANVWALPQRVDPAPWMPHVAAAWQEVSPGVFGRPEHWKEDARWRTPSERAAAIEIQNLREARETAIAKFDQFEDDAQQRLQLSTDEADARERRLLTTKGSALVEAVEETLATLGFEVRDMDEVHPDRDKREDLRVTHPSDPAWEAIIEVKGYARSGAAVGDLSKLIRHKGRYQNAEKREPSACWYVVNQFYEQDPAMRQPLLASNPAEVEDFVVEDRGALIDTAQLFELVVSVQSGESSPEDVAARLIALRGHL